jgi:hypothetical protein
MPHVIILAKNWRKLEDAVGGDPFPKKRGIGFNFRVVLIF